MKNYNPEPSYEIFKRFGENEIFRLSVEYQQISLEVRARDE